MKLLLTSCGLETEAIKEKFLEILEKDVKDTKALFVPTAAIDPDAIGVLPKCMNDLLKCDIPKKNIVVYDMHFPMALDELKTYDVVYICGGNTEYLLNRINEQGFGNILLQYLEEGGFVIGVSAGSLIFANNLSDNLRVLKCGLDVHCNEDVCENPGMMDEFRENRIYLGNYQAIVIDNNLRYIIG